MPNYTGLLGIAPQGLLGQESPGLLGQTAAPPTYAQKIAAALRNMPYAIAQGLQGNAVGTADPKNAVTDMARQNWWRGSVMGMPEDVKQRNIGRAMDIAMAAPTVYHGSPHKFDAFDSSKIGTGEGAQAYGHGLYFAESPEVAKGYQKALGQRNAQGEQMRGWLDGVGYDQLPPGPEKTAITWLDSWGNAKSAAKAAKNNGLNDVASILEDIAAGRRKYTEKTGSLYTVDLPDSAAAKMLDWDKPLSQQPQNVRDAFKKAMDFQGVQSYVADGQRVYLGIGEESAMTGADVYRKLGASSSEKSAGALKQLGIPGIRYLDGGSRGTGAGTSNYVVFPGNESLLKILKRE